MKDTHSVRMEDEDIEDLKRWSHTDNTSEALRNAVQQVIGPWQRMESVGATAGLLLAGALILDEVSLSPWVGYVLIAIGTLFLIVDFLELLLVAQSGAEDS